MNTYFGLAFLSQIVLVSLYYPRRLTGMIGGGLSEPGGAEAGSQERNRSRLSLYTTANWIVGGLGLVLLATLLWADAFDSLRVRLLAIGAFFFFQLSPLALVRGLLDGRSARASIAPEPVGEQDSGRLFDFVSPLLVGVAGVLFIAYVATHLPSLEEGWTEHVTKVLIYVGSNALFAAALGWNLYALGRERGEARVKRLQDLRKLAPILVYISIGLSVYFFGKDVIADLGAAHVRPLVMIVFLQLLAGLAFSTMIGREA